MRRPSASFSPTTCAVADLLAVDPGNYATDIAAGASYRFRLLFVVLMSNLFAILLQSLAIRSAP